MRILRFFDDDGSVHLGIRRGDMVDDLGVRSPRELMEGAAPATLKSVPRAGLKLDAPIRDVPKLLALAGNYRKHIAESGFTTPEENSVITPQVFCKPPSTAINKPGGVVHVFPNSVFVDWEIELAVVIGKRGRDIAAADAMSYVFGYTVINDISERKFNAKVEHRKVREYDPFFDWLIGKWFDGHAPIGPDIVTADEVADPHNLPIRLWVNGELMQDSNTSYMIFNVPETIAYASTVMTLEPGDVIAMGTPEGVGSARGISLKPGDELKGEIEGIGVLENSIALWKK